MLPVTFKPVTFKEVTGTLCNAFILKVCAQNLAFVAFHNYLDYAQSFQCRRNQ